MSRRWNAEDYEQLREGWGNMKGGIQALALDMGRSVASLKIKASRLHLGPWLNAGEFMTVNILLKALYGENAYHAYTYTRLLKLGMPVYLRKNDTARFRMVKIEEFWRWAERHQRDLNFANFEEGTLGIEPDWVKQKRIRDRENKRLVFPKKSRWNPHEDALLRTMCERGATWAELDAAFQRSSDGIRRRIYDLGLPHPTHNRGRSRQNSWSTDELETIKRLFKEGYSYDYIARRLGRSSQSIRGKVEWLKGRQKEWR